MIFFRFPTATVFFSLCCWDLGELPNFGERVRDGTGWHRGHHAPGGVSRIWIHPQGPGEEQRGRCPARVPARVTASRQGQAPHIMRRSIATDWHFTAALRCCQGREVAPANESRALCSVAPPFLAVNGPFLSPGNVILHHAILL